MIMIQNGTHSREGLIFLPLAVIRFLYFFFHVTLSIDIAIVLALFTWPFLGGPDPQKISWYSSSYNLSTLLFLEIILCSM